MMKKIILLLTVCLVSSVAFSQQLFQQTQFMVNPYTLNPALAGSEDFVDIKAGYRNQWAGFRDDFNDIGAVAPVTMYLSAHTALGHDHGYYKDPRHEHKAFHGVGGYVTSDKLGAFTSTSFYGSYSYNMLLLKSKKSTGKMYGFNGKERSIGTRMIIGAHLGAVNQKIDPDKLFTDPDQGTDPLVASITGGGGFAPDGSVGIWIYSNQYYLGAAVRRILANDVKVGTDFSLSRHYNVMAGYKVMLSDFMQFEPSVNIKYENGAIPSADLNGELVYDNTYTNSRGSAAHKNKDLHVYVGATYRYGAAVAILLGGVIERKYEVAYSFDLTTSRIGAYESGTHEVTIGYRLLPGRHFQTAEGHHHR